jgi:hypothetical protein
MAWLKIVSARRSAWEQEAVSLRRAWPWAFGDDGFGLQEEQPGATSGQVGGLGHVDGLIGLGGVSGLVAHRGQDLAAEAFVTGEAGQGHGWMR